MIIHSRPSFTYLLCLLLILLATPLSADEDRSQFGNSSNPVWSVLTQFEETTLALAPKAKQGDPDALLRLYLAASGDIRDERSYRRIRDRLDSWLEKVKPIVQSAGGRWQQGDKLNQLMHQEFFLKGESIDQVNAGYDYDQSQLSEVFRNKTYNCISASLLFSVLAQKLDFKTLGILLPSHAFIELEVSPGQSVEVETTSSSGFGIEHDESFYQDREFKDWYTSRGITPSTY